MSQIVDATCPQCGTTHEMTLWSSVNVTVDPHLKEEVMQQRINVFTCANCGHRSFANTSLLYHDMNERYCIQYVTKEDMKSQDFYSSLRKDGTVIVDPISAAAMKAAGEDYFIRPHQVFSMMELLLYIAFRDLCATWGKET